MRTVRSVRYLLAFASVLLVALILNLGLPTSRGQLPADQQKGQPHPHPQPRPAPPVVKVDGNTVTVSSSQSAFPACNPADRCDPFLYPPGNNLLPTVYTNAYDSSGAEIPNTLPSTPVIPYNLHDGDPKITVINSSGDPTYTPSPQDDLRFQFDAIFIGAQKQSDATIQKSIGCALAVLEGDTPCATRAYAGFPLLHYQAGKKVQKVD